MIGQINIELANSTLPEGIFNLVDFSDGAISVSIPLVAPQQQRRDRLTSPSHRNGAKSLCRPFTGPAEGRPGGRKTGA